MATIAKVLGVVWFVLAIIFLMAGIYGAFNVEDVVDATEEDPSAVRALILLGTMLIAMVLATFGSVAFVIGKLGQRDAAPPVAPRVAHTPAPYPAAPPYPAPPPYGSAS